MKVAPQYDSSQVPIFRVRNRIANIGRYKGTDIEYLSSRSNLWPAWERIVKIARSDAIQRREADNVALRVTDEVFPG